MKFGTILADPAWFYQTWSALGRSRSPDRHYHCMKTSDICALPVADIAAENSALLLWTSGAHLLEALLVMRSWGFTYKTYAPWLKTAPNGKPRPGLGYLVRSCSELILIGTQGEVAPVPSKRPLGGMISQRGAHSEKPNDQYRIAQAFPGPYIELFARRQRPDWVSLGDEIDGRDIRESLPALVDQPRLEL